MREQYDIRRPVITTSVFPYYAKRLLAIAVIASVALIVWSRQASIGQWWGKQTASPVVKKKSFAQREREGLAAEEGSPRRLNSGPPRRVNSGTEGTQRTEAADAAEVTIAQRPRGGRALRPVEAPSTDRSGRGSRARRPAPVAE